MYTCIYIYIYIYTHSYVMMHGNVFNTLSTSTRASTGRKLSLRTHAIALTIISITLLQSIKIIFPVTLIQIYNI